MGSHILVCVPILRKQIVSLYPWFGSRTGGSLRRSLT